MTIEITDEMVYVYVAAAGHPEWLATEEIRQGLAAVLAMVERDNELRPRPWCGAAKELGGQQPCPLKIACGTRECAVGQASGSETYRSAP